MNLVSWMTLVFLLSAGSSLAVDVNLLTDVVNAITAKYSIAGEYCLAAEIPLNTQDRNTLLANVRKDDLEKTLQENKLYKSTNVVVAKPLKPDEERGQPSKHAEFRVLKNLGQWPNNQRNFLLIYTKYSPCVGRCTNPNEDEFSILPYIKAVVNNWLAKVAFVFTNVYDKNKCGNSLDHNTCATEQELRDSLKRLGNTGPKGIGLGLKNIFRCYRPSNLGFQCHSCLSRSGAVSDACVQQNFVPGQQSEPLPEPGGSSARGSNQPEEGGEEGEWKTIKKKTKNKGRKGQIKDSSSIGIIGSWIDPGQQPEQLPKPGGSSASGSNQRKPGGSSASGSNQRKQGKKQKQRQKRRNRGE